MADPAGKHTLVTMEQVSAGGVAFRRAGDLAEVAICKIVPEMRWQLPKGVIDAGETAEIAAVREVREEAGIVAEIVAPIETIEYWFIANYTGEPVRYHKFVHFFLMEFRSGDVGDHDHEVAEAAWRPIDTAVEMLAFKSEKEIVKKAGEMIAKTAAD